MLPRAIYFAHVLCQQAGGELEQIPVLAGHVSVQTTERYLGCEQRLQNTVNDKVGLEPAEIQRYPPSWPTCDDHLFP
jgi:hypothetical protein